uniref:Uncharacterized protein n=1 Tax=Acrobeloides nanus TaxID=290746 RepID=A0A914CG93_9BILA
MLLLLYFLVGNYAESMNETTPVRFCYIPTPFSLKNYDHFSCYEWLYGNVNGSTVTNGFTVNDQLYRDIENTDKIEDLWHDYTKQEFDEFINRLFEYRNNSDPNVKILISIGGPTSNDEIRNRMSLQDHEKYECYTDATFSYTDATFGHIDATFIYIDATFGYTKRCIDILKVASV